jgi:MFS family permease
MTWLSIFTLACGFSQSEISIIILRAIQGLGAAASVPSSIGIVTSFFTGRERNYALSIYGACGALGSVSLSACPERSSLVLIICFSLQIQYGTHLWRDLHLCTSDRLSGRL